MFAMQKYSLSSELDRGRLIIPRGLRGRERMEYSKHLVDVQSAGVSSQVYSVWIAWINFIRNKLKERRK